MNSGGDKETQHSSNENLYSRYQQRKNGSLVSGYQDHAVPVMNL